MARINIEDSLFRDGRFLDLIIKAGDKDKALGMLVRAFIVAQAHYLTDVSECLADASARLIPLNDWKKQGCSDLLIEVGLAEQRGSYIYVSGSERQFKWLIQKQKAGQKGGLSRSKAGASGCLAQDSGSKPLSLTHSLTLNKNKKNTKKKGFKIPDDELERLYQKYPRRMGKTKGFEKLRKILKSENDVAEFEKALDRFAELTAKQKTEPQFIPHFSTFVNSHWQDYLDDDVGATATEKLQGDRDWWIPESDRTGDQ
jgi:hypothetical protein